MELSDIIAGMVKDVRSGKVKTKKKPAKAKTDPVKAERKRAFIANPFIDEAVCLVVNTYICTCGKEHTFPNYHPFIRKTRVNKGQVEIHMEKIHHSMIGACYSHLPRVIEHEQTEIHECQDCFQPTDNPFHPLQMKLPLEVM